ncbi:acyltransferase [Planctomycetales bacterium]|nr:acyltransferase [Planctomycetales bacterium]
MLSGVVLSLSYWRRRNLDTLTGLAWRRPLRLGIPIFFSTIFIYEMLLGGLMCNLEAGKIPSPSNGWILSFYRFSPSLSDALTSVIGALGWNNTQYNGVLWTITPEILGSYLVIILLLAQHSATAARNIVIASRGKSWRWRVRLATLFIGLFALLLLEKSPLMAAFVLGLFIAKFWVKASAATLAKIRQNRWAQIGIPLTVLAICGMRINEAGLVLLAALIVFAAVSVGRFNRFLQSRFSVWLGKISFPLYLVHLPLICSFQSYLLLVYPEYQTEWTVKAAIGAATALLSFLAAVLFLPIEKFSIAAARKFSDYVLGKNKEPLRITN